MNEFEYRITEQVYNWIVVGTKKVEVRLYNEKSSKIKVNDIINFKVLDNEYKSIKVRVIELLVYKDIYELLKNVDIKQEAQKGKSFLKDLWTNPIGKIKEIAKDETNSCQ